MATGWAVASATLVALTLANVLVGDALGEGATRAILVVLLAALYGAWTYGIAMAAHGSKGALAALFVYALVWAFGWNGALFFVTRGDVLTGALHMANLIVGALGAWSIWMELGARRGAVRWGDFALLALPLAAALLVFALAN